MLNYAEENIKVDSFQNDYMKLKVQLIDMKNNVEQKRKRNIYLFNIILINVVLIILSLYFNMMLLVVIDIILFIIITVIYLKAILKGKEYRQIIDKINEYVHKRNISNKIYVPSVFLPPKKVKKFKLIVLDPITILRSSKTEEEFKYRISKFYNNLKTDI